jgi:SAM-dependent methyltransferase
MALHLESAARRATRVHQGFAAALPFADGAFDAVLLLGPLYHLEEREERVAALVEARRVCRNGGLIVAAAISRLAPLLGVVKSGRILDGDVLANVRDETQTGRRVPPERRTGLFPRAWFHLPSQLREKCAAAGLDVRGLFGVEGPAWLIGEFLEAWSDAAGREGILAAARELEQHEDVMALSPHLLAVAFCP